jgi:hypothetical protein
MSSSGKSGNLASKQKQEDQISSQAAASMKREEKEQKASRSSTALPNRRKGEHLEGIPKTDEDVIFRAMMAEVRYIDPLGTGLGYPDWQHR